MFSLDNIFNAFGYKPGKKDIAKLLKSSPEALERFEEAYKKNYLDKVSDNLFEVSAAQASELRKQSQEEFDDSVPALSFADWQNTKLNILEELIAQTPVYSYKKGQKAVLKLPAPAKQLVTAEELKKLPESLRPQLTGYLMKRDTAALSYPIILENYAKFLHEKNKEKKQQAYNRFRQGLDMLDLDPVLYEMLSNNPNSIGHWFSKLAEATDADGNLGMFRLPDTTIIKVPMPLLQLARMDYMSLAPATIRILNEYCQKVFELDEYKSYFVKTGTYSSKFDFRNAKVIGEKEVTELGEYLMYINFQANSMAHYNLSSERRQPSIYGVSTTNEWCVREYIKDEDSAPTIYNGLPLHCEYRLFVDFDAKQVLAIHPYWDEEVMRKRFNEGPDKYEPKNLHDAVTFEAYSDILRRKYNSSKELVALKMQELLQKTNIDLKGQWSVDIMKNGSTYWLIDMALAQNSAYYSCVPEELRKPVPLEEEPWLPAPARLQEIMKLEEKQED